MSDCHFTWKTMFSKISSLGYTEAEVKKKTQIQQYPVSVRVLEVEYSVYLNEGTKKQISSNSIFSWMFFVCVCVTMELILQNP